ncbi:phosphonate ABC transporter substrate-binding protein [Azospirillum sp. SYSU D00513]|uniref:phosphonate ABC transporter substrate-binding protein n=1 Tax=Azospirillum sp. SYSU D00513 TaxID=2812561 RepID=UPI001A959991|nr:phosphonate ABC transporter substrate-binding protein [Azospirillum sp. SYSU D00513]
MKRTIVAAGVLLSGLCLSGAARADLKELSFGIISTESSQNLKQDWQPLLEDMEKQTGMKVRAFFAPDYAGIIEGMRFDKVQVAWYGNKAAMEAVDRAGGEVFAQSVDVSGNPGYWSHLIVHKDSPLASMEDVLKKAGSLSFGNGDPNSTSGFLVPGYYVFAQNGIADPKAVFKRVVSANHETNALAVANGQVDVATNNNENLGKIQDRFPEKYAQIKVIWTSPLIPADPLVWRKDLSDGDKKKIKDFLLGYGVKTPGKPDAQLERESKVLAGLKWAPFKESTNSQLIPIRQLELFKARTKIETTEMPAEEKAAKLADIDAQLARLKTLASAQ